MFISPPQVMADTPNTQPTNQNAQQPNAAEQAQKPAPSVAEQAAAQSKEAMAKAQQTMGQAKEVGQNVTAGAQQVAGQATQVMGQAGQVFGKAASLLSAKSSQPQPPVTADEKLWGALAYVPMVALVAFLIKPHSDFVKLHGRQGLLIFLIFFFTIFLYVILPPIGPLFGGLIQLAMFVIGVFSVYQAFMGNWWKIPVLGGIADALPVEMFTQTATTAITGQQPAAQPPMEQAAPVEQTPPQNPPADQGAQTPPAPPAQQ